jgi:hypothetical protein
LGSPRRFRSRTRAGTSGGVGPADRAGDLIEQRLRLAFEGANSGAKALTVVGLMLAGGDCMDDTALLRAGAAG